MDKKIPRDVPKKIEKIDIISADQMSLDYEKSIKDAEKQIENIT